MNRKNSSNYYYKREMDKLERQQNDIQDKYNTLDENAKYNIDMHTKRITDSNLEYAPEKGESLLSYSAKVQAYAKIAAKNNIKSHIDGPKGPWYTHYGMPQCFMCDDMNLISVLIRVLQDLSQKYPDTTF